ncbi:MAG: riboflavin synthase [Thermoleophilia bacterium]|nr:riboflavin synthase [Thermoleophilia bacterium]
MFTGLIEEVGTVVRLVRRPEGAQVFVDARKVLQGTRLGDSIAVNGACLTVVDLRDDRFAVDCMPETLARSTIGELSPGDQVNLERALALGDRLGGHLVLGHVDGVGRILSVKARGVAREIRVEMPDDLRPYVAAKGSVAVDGISLTVTDVGERDFGLGIIPHTLTATTLRRVDPGRRVNLEVDVLARYAHRALMTALGQGKPAPREDGLTEEYLREAGFLE